MTSKATKALRKSLMKAGPTIADQIDGHDELASFMFDDSYDSGARRRGISPLNEETYLLIREKFEKGIYPESAVSFAIGELNLVPNAWSEDLQNKYLAVKKVESNNYLKEVGCPSCKSKEVVVSRGIYQCLHCKERGDIFTFYKKAHQLTLEGAIERAYLELSS
jgi:ribosomal protein L37AE/L43A